MNLSIAAELCRTFEGFRAKPYLCPAGIPTIGYGSTYYAGGRKVTLNDPPITREQANILLLAELTHTFAPGVIRQCPDLAHDEKRFNAIVDFAYNLGVGRLQTSTLRRKINQKDWGAAKEQLMLWTRARGKILPGLVARRKAEYALF